MSYSGDLGRAAKNAFSSPSNLASRRFSSRLSPRSRSSDGDSHSVAGSRRSISMIQSEEDAEIFEQMNVTTSVRFKKPSRRSHQIGSSHSSVQSVGDSTAGGGGSQVEEFVRGVNEAAQRLMLQLQVSASNSFTQPPAVPKLEARDIEQEDMVLSNWSMRDGERLQGEEDDEDYGASRRSVRDRSVASSQRTPLNLGHNDNTFHVLASLVVEFMEARLTPNGKTVVLQPEDKNKLERVLPETIRKDFMDAVRYRLERAPEHAATPIDFVTLQCRELGLHRDGRLNPILVAGNLGENPSFVQLIIPDTLESTMTLSFHSQPSLSFNPTPVVYEEDEEKEASSLDDDHDDSGSSNLENPETNAPPKTNAPPAEEEGASATEALDLDEDGGEDDEDNIEDVGAEQRYHHSMVSTMTTLDEGDKHQDQDNGSLERPSLDGIDQLADQEPAGDINNVIVSPGASGGSTGNLTPMGIEMTFSDAGSKVQALSNRSGSGSKASSYSGKTDEQGNKSLAEKSAAISAEMPCLESPKAGSPVTDSTAIPENFASRLHCQVLPAELASSTSDSDGPPSHVPPNTPAELPVLMATEDEPSLPADLSAENEQVPTGQSGVGRPPLPPTTGTSTGDSRHFVLQEPAVLSMRDDSNTVSTDTKTTGSSSTVLNINPFANLAGLLSPSSATESRSTLQDDLERKRKDIALRAMHSGDYPLSDIIPSPAAEAELDHESLARQQLMAELREAKTLVEESENPEITKFWEDHVLYLQFRLRALDGQDIYTSEEFASEIAESNRRLIEEISQREQYMAEEEPRVVTPSHHSLDGDSAGEISLRKNDDKIVPMGLPDEVLASRSSFSSDHSTQQKQHFDPPVGEPVDADEVVTQNPRSNTVPATVNVKEETNEGSEYVRLSDDLITMNAPQNTLFGVSGTLPEPHYDLPMVDVVSPADLPGGYHFEAEIEGKRFLATVPHGGVQQGETFTCYMRDLDSVAIDIPVGYWRDNLSSLCDFGCCHPVIWNSLFCPLLVLSQVQYRLGFDFLGRGIQKDGYSSNPEHLSNRAMMLIITASWLLINLGIYSGYNWKWSRGLDLTVADTSAVILVNVAMYGFVVFVTQSTRSSLREKFLIREQRCHDLEDIVLATTCLPCTVGQMSRHTANYDDYEAVCCSKTGLPDGVRVNQSRKEEGDYMV